MSDFHHGMQVVEINDGTRVISTVSTAIIGMVCTASDADAATFPLNTPVLITNVLSAAGKAGKTGTLGDVGETELARISRKALDIQTALGGDATESIQIAAIMMKNGLAKNSDEAFDLMVSGMQRVSAQMRGELPEILHEYSTHFRNMGFSGSEAMTLLVDMAQQGKFALDKTGDAVKEFSIRGSDMSKASIEAYDAAGLNAAKMSTAIASGGDKARAAMQKTANGLLKIKDPAERANAAIALFGTPIEDLSIDQIPKFLAALAGAENKLGDVSGAADRMGDTLRDNLEGDIGRLQGAMSSLRFNLFNDDDGALRKLTQAATEWLTRVNEWVKANPELTRQIVMVGGAATALITALGGIGLVAWPVMSGINALVGGAGLLSAGLRFAGTRGITPLSGGLNRLGGMIGWLAKSPLMLLRAGASALTSVFGAVSNPLTIIRGAMSGFGRVLMWLFTSPLALLRTGITLVGSALGMLLSPVGLAVAAIVGGALLIWKYWEPIQAFIGGVVEGFVAASAPIIAAFEPLQPVFTWIGDKIKALFGWFGDLLTPVKSTAAELDSAASMGKRFGEALASGLNIIMNPLESLKKGVSWLLEKLGLVDEKSKNLPTADSILPPEDAAALKVGVSRAPTPQGNDAKAIAARYNSVSTPDIAAGSANVTSRQDTAAMASATMNMSTYRPIAPPVQTRAASSPASIHAPISIVAQPGQSERGIAQEVTRQLEQRERAALQFLGVEEEKITLSGELLPEITGGTLSLLMLETMADQGRAWPLIEGSGTIYGMFVVNSISQTKTDFFTDGRARRIEFTITLTRMDSSLSAMLGDLRQQADGLIGSAGEMANRAQSALGGLFA
ncbi:phage tail tape measure protein [Pectobacterium brasiliense]|uniref:phage tail tape measure protein n=1 Tax=Pectobacterium brasiliense TaxID=180957 RepID=UPI001F07EFB3|nr:phage tail tape measure protein [Pectobacterium brasiliense]